MRFRRGTAISFLLAPSQNNIPSPTMTKTRSMYLCYLASRKNFAEKCKHCDVELVGPLQRCEMAHTAQID